MIKMIRSSRLLGSFKRSFTTVNADELKKFAKIGGYFLFYSAQQTNLIDYFFIEIGGIVAVMQVLDLCML